MAKIIYDTDTRDITIVENKQVIRKIDGESRKDEASRNIFIVNTGSDVKIQNNYGDVVLDVTSVLKDPFDGFGGYDPYLESGDYTHVGVGDGFFCEYKEGILFAVFGATELPDTASEGLLRYKVIRTEQARFFKFQAIDETGSEIENDFFHGVVNFINSTISIAGEIGTVITDANCAITDGTVIELGELPEDDVEESDEDDSNTDSDEEEDSDDSESEDEDSEDEPDDNEDDSGDEDTEEDDDENVDDSSEENEDSGTPDEEDEEDEPEEEAENVGESGDSGETPEDPPEEETTE